MNRAFEMSAIFRGIDRLSNPMRRMNSNFNRFTGTHERYNRTARKSNAFMSNSFLGLGKQILGVTLLYSVWDKLIIGTMRKGVELEDILISAGQRFLIPIKKGTDEYERMQQLIRWVGANTEFTATQAAEGFRELAKAGLEFEQSLIALPKITDFATATGLDYQRTSQIMMDSLDTFNLKVKKTDPSSLGQLADNIDRIQDSYLLTANTFTLDIDQIFESVKKGGGQIQEAGGHIEQYLTLLGAVTGIAKGEIAGVGLNNIFLQLSNKEVRKKIQGLGIEVADLEGQFRNPIDVLMDLKDKVIDLSQVERGDILQDLFDRRSIKFVNQIFKKTREELKAFENRLIQTTGTTSRMAIEMRKSLGASFKEFGSSFEEIQLSIYNVIAPSVKMATDLFTGMMRAIAPVTKEGKNIGRIIEPVIKLTGFILQMVVATKMWAGAVWLMNRALWANPLTWIIGSLYILTALFPETSDKVLDYAWVIVGLTMAIKAYGFWTDIATKKTILWTTIMKGWGFVSSLFGPGIVGLQLMIRNWWLHGATGQASWLKISSASTTAWAWMLAKATAGTAWLTAGWAWIAATGVSAWGAIATAAATAWTIITAPISLIILAVVALGALIWYFWDDIVAGATATWEWLKGIFTNPIDVLKWLNPITAVLAVLEMIFPETFGGITDRIFQFFENTWQNIKNLFTDPSTYLALLSPILYLGKLIATFLPEQIDKAVDYMTSKFFDGVDKIADFFGFGSDDGDEGSPGSSGGRNGSDGDDGGFTYVPTPHVLASAYANNSVNVNNFGRPEDVSVETSNSARKLNVMRSGSR